MRKPHAEEVLRYWRSQMEKDLRREEAERRRRQRHHYARFALFWIAFILFMAFVAPHIVIYLW